MHKVLSVVRGEGAGGGAEVIARKGSEARVKEEECVVVGAGPELRAGA